MRFALRKMSPIVTLGTCLVLVLTMVAPASAQAPGWQPGPGAILENTYAGFVDQPTNGATVPSSGGFSVFGWFVDQTAQGWAYRRAQQGMTPSPRDKRSEWDDEEPMRVVLVVTPL